MFTGQSQHCNWKNPFLPWYPRLAEKGNLDAWKYPHMAVMDGFDMEDKAIDYLKGHKTYMEYLAENGYHCALSGNGTWVITSTRKRI